MDNIIVSINSPVKYYDFVDQHGDVLATFKFVPSDIDIFERQEAVHKEFEVMQEELKKLLDTQATMDDKTATQLKNKYAKSMKEKFDYLFNADSSGFFELASPFTPLENGEPWAAVILESVRKIVEQETGKNFKEMESKSAKYTREYKAAPGKYPFPTK